MKNPFLILDGSSILVRAYFASAFGGRIMRSSQGVYTNGVMGFLNMLFKLLEQTEPSHVFVAWDVSRDTFRRELYPLYKGTRGELPLELHPQFQTMQEVLRSLGISQYANEKYEADDLIGTLAYAAGKEGHEVLIVTGDQDALQLVSPSTTVAIMKKGITEMLFYTPDSLKENWGLTPSQIIDLKGLMGDTSDNIPGVPGIGEKTAKKLLLEFETLENLLANSHLISGKLREKIEVNRELAVLSKKLATILLDVPMPHGVEACKLNLSVDTATDLLRELELHRVVLQLQKMVAAG